MKKWIWILIAGALIAGGSYAWIAQSKASRAKADRGQIVIARRGVIEQTVDSTGEVDPLNRVEIKPPISGRIEQLLVDEGDNVKAGQVLAWMSSSDRAAILDAARAQGQKEAKYWEDAYKPTPIVAPLSGVIILRNVVVGQTVDSTIVLYAMSDKLIVMAHVDEADIGRVKIGMISRITLDAYPDTVVDGKVSQILFEGKNVSNVITYGVKIEPGKVPPFFRSQMTANVSLLTNRKENAILLPSISVQDRNGTHVVLVPVPNEKPEKREVETGIDNGQSVEILSGIDEGEKVLVSSKKYTPQKGPQNSPLTMGPGKPGQGGGGSGGRNR